MTVKRQLNIADIVNDIRTGLNDEGLMAKYGLSAKGIQRAFEKLVEMGAVTKADIESRGQLGDDSVFFRSMREIPRHYLVVPIPVYEMGQYPHAAGKIRDLTEKGLGIMGIQAKVHDTKVFSILPGDFVTVPPFSFKAVCRWMDRREVEEFVGGFEITAISEDSLAKLRQLIQDLTFGES